MDKAAAKRPLGTCDLVKPEYCYGGTLHVGEHEHTYVCVNWRPLSPPAPTTYVPFAGDSNAVPAAKAGEKRPTSLQLEVFHALIPAYCPNCGELFEKKDVRADEKALSYKTFCGYCGAIYETVRPEY